MDLISPFLQLPSADDYPDYYESITHPIDMSMIKDKVGKGQVPHPYVLIISLSHSPSV